MKKMCIGITAGPGKWALLIAISAFLICYGTNLQAQEALETDVATNQARSETSYQTESVIVTAQKREEDVQDVTDSITVLDEIDISDAGITDMTTLSTHIPNFEFYSFGSRWHCQTYIRGIKTLNNGHGPTINCQV